MKKSNLIFIIFILGILLTIIIYKKNKCANTDLYGKWQVCHIIYGGREILENDIKNKGYNVDYDNTGTLYISVDGTTTFYKRDITGHNSIRIEASFIKSKEQCFFKMQSDFNEINGSYHIIEEGFTHVYIDSYPYKEIRFILKNDLTTIYLKKYEQQW